MNTKTYQFKVDELPTSFAFHHDAAHGWLEVPYTTIRMLQLEDQISSFSYRSKETVYLEEDVDAILFIDAYLQTIGRIDYQYFHSLCTDVYEGDSSPIRNYPHYTRQS